MGSDHYARLGVARTATQADIKRAYRKLARKYHPDVSKESDAEAQFKAVSEAYKTLHDPGKRAEYDAAGQRPDVEGPSVAAANWNNDLFEAIFRQHVADTSDDRRANVGSIDQHAKLRISLQDSYRGTRRSFALRVPGMEERQLDVNIPRGIRDGQHLRLAGQGTAARDNVPAGDLYLEIEIAPDSRFRVDGSDVYAQLPVAPWEAALGASIKIPTPDGSVQIKVPAGSADGRKLRLKALGIPGAHPGDFYAVLSIALPPADSDLARESYLAMAKSFSDFNPRQALAA